MRRIGANQQFPGEWMGNHLLSPRSCPQPMKEELIWSGPPRPTHEAYWLAKIAGMKLGQAYRRGPLNWRPGTSLRDGLEATYQWFLRQEVDLWPERAGRKKEALC